ncbi:MAG TPA: TusE/DsrC/DsvC family sulfur relay protein [Thiolinea sp.]|nr:TusE/DsrC/DsvC family sulfur relay protein [Thiolinea sp.]
MQESATYSRDAEGYLVHPEDWSTDIAARLAAEEQIELLDEHWVVLRFVRDYWEEHRITPDIRHVAKHLAEVQEIDKKAAKQQLFQLFPYGYVKQTCKIAGMQRPRAWSTG